MGTTVYHEGSSRLRFPSFAQGCLLHYVVVVVAKFWLLSLLGGFGIVHCLCRIKQGRRRHRGLCHRQRCWFPQITCRFVVLQKAGFLGIRFGWSLVVHSHVVVVVAKFHWTQTLHVGRSCSSCCDDTLMVGKTRHGRYRAMRSFHDSDGMRRHHAAWLGTRRAVRRHADMIRRRRNGSAVGGG